MANAVVVVAAVVVVVVVVVVFKATMLEFLLDLQMIVSRPEKIRSVLNSFKISIRQIQGLCRVIAQKINGVVVVVVMW